MSISRQQRRYRERQQVKASRNSVRNRERPVPRFSITQVLTILATLLSISISCFFYWPALDVVAVPWDNSSGPLSAKFEFRNSGRVPLLEVNFDCLVNSSTARDIRTSANSSRNPLTGRRGQVIGSLAPGAFVTRDCSGGGMISAGPHPSNVKIEATYLWPVIAYRASLTRYFVSETDGSRVWMTLETPPSR